MAGSEAVSGSCPPRRGERKSGGDASTFIVALEGFEPSQAEPESDVLPLHHKAIPNIVKEGLLLPAVSLGGSQAGFWPPLRRCLRLTCAKLRTFLKLTK